MANDELGSVEQLVLIDKVRDYHRFVTAVVNAIGDVSKTEALDALDKEFQSRFVRLPADRTLVLATEPAQAQAMEDNRTRLAIETEHYNKQQALVRNLSEFEEDRKSVV